MTRFEGVRGLALLVDDNEEARERLASELVTQGWAVISCSSGSDGLRALGEHSPTLVLVELYMEDLDGIEFLRAAREVHPGVPVVAMAGADRRTYGPMAGVAKHMGARLVLPKPVPVDRLFDLLGSSDVA